jgi:hypothetical protein
MDDVKALDHIDTGTIESRGYKLIKEFLADPDDDVLEVHTEAIAYAEKLADTTQSRGKATY